MAHYRGNKKGYKKREERLFVNDQIKAPKMLLIAENGERMGVMPRQKVIMMSQQQEKDIIQMHYDRDTMTATVKLVDLGKYLYEKQKTEKEKKKTQKKQQLKQIKFRYTIADNDYERILQQAKEFLVEGNQLKVSVRLRGREKSAMFREKVYERLMNMINELEEVGKAHHRPKYEGNSFVLMIVPKGK